MKLTIANHLYTWDPVKWFSQLFLYGKFKKKTLAKTLDWNIVLMYYMRDVPEEVSPKLYANLQEMRRDIMHFHVDLKRNKL